MAIAATVIRGLYLLGSIGLFAFGVVEGFQEGFDDEPERDATGEVVEGGDLLPSKLRVGDCFDEPQLEDLGGPARASSTSRRGPASRSSRSSWA